MTDKALSSFLFGDILPQAFFKRVTLETSSPSLSRAELKLMLKNVIESGEAVNLFNEHDIYKHFSALIYTSFDSDATNFLLENINSLFKEDIKGQGIGGDGSYNFRFLKLPQIFDPNTSSEQFDNDGNRVVSTAINVPNLFPNEGRHLTYFAVLGVDVTDPNFQQQFGISDPSLFEDLESSIYNKPIIFKALDNGDIVSARASFITLEDKIWVGDIDVDQDEGGTVMFEGITAEGNIPLTLRDFPLNIVQDFRDLDRVDSTLQISNVPKDLTLLREEIKFLNNDNMDVEKKETYVSNICLSRSLNGNAKLVFSMDYFNLLRNKSLFGNLINNASFEEFSEKTRISSLKILRRRVKNIKDKNRLNSSFAASNVLFNDEEIEEVITLSADNENSLSFIPQNTGNNQISEIDLSFSSDKKIRTFNVLDNDLTLKTFGKYQYGVEIQIQDNTYALFQTILDSLEISRQKLLEYYNDSLSFSRLPNQIQGRTSNRERHYDPTMDIFTSRFVQFSGEKYPGLTFVSNIHNDILNFYRLLGSSDYNVNMITSFNSMVNPATGTPKGILTFTNFADLNISLLRKILKQNLSKTEPKSNLNFSSSNKTATEKGGGKNEIEYRTFFTTDFADVEDSKFVGIDYFNEESLSSTGLDVFDISKIDIIARNNNDIYYDDGDVTYISIKGTQYQLLAAKYSFLNPLIFHFGSSYQYEAKTLNEGNYDFIIQNIINYNLTKDSETYLRIVNPEDSNQTNTQATEESLLRGIYSSFSVTFPALQNTDGNPADLLTQINTPAGNELTSYGSQGSLDPIPASVAQQAQSVALGVYQDPNFILRKMLKTFLENNSFSKSGETFNLFAKNKEYNKIQLNPPPTPINPQDVTLGTLGIAPNPTPLDYDMNTDEIYNPVPSLAQDNAVVDLMKNSLYYGSLRTITTNDLSRAPKSINNQDVTALINRLPNQVKSLFAWKDGSNAVNQFLKGIRGTPRYDDIIRDKNSVFIILYTMLKKVEYLSGYDILEGGNRIKNAQWSVLDNIAVDNLSGGKYLLCRIVDYNPKELALSRSSILDMPVLNKYFLVRKDSFRNPLLGRF